MGNSKKIKQARRAGVSPIPLKSHPGFAVYLITEDGNVLGTVEPKKPKPAKIWAGRKAERPSQYGTFSLFTVSWGFSMTPTAPRMKAARVVNPPEGPITRLKEKALASIGSPLLTPSLLEMRRTAILKM